MQIIFTAVQFITSSNLNFQNATLQIRKNIKHFPLSFYKSSKIYTINHNHDDGKKILNCKYINEIWNKYEVEVRNFFEIESVMILETDFSLIPLFYRKDVVNVGIWFKDCKNIYSKCIDLETKINFISSINNSSIRNERFNLISGILNYKDKELLNVNQFIRDKVKLYLDNESTLELQNVFNNIKNYISKIDILFL